MVTTRPTWMHRTMIACFHLLGLEEKGRLHSEEYCVWRIVQPDSVFDTWNDLKDNGYIDLVYVLNVGETFVLRYVYRVHFQLLLFKISPLHRYSPRKRKRSIPQDQLHKKYSPQFKNVQTDVHFVRHQD